VELLQPFNYFAGTGNYPLSNVDAAIKVEYECLKFPEINVLLGI
jgi:hypothetical protein